MMGGSGLRKAVGKFRRHEANQKGSEGGEERRRCYWKTGRPLPERGAFLKSSAMEQGNCLLGRVGGMVKGKSEVLGPRGGRRKVQEEGHLLRI